MADLKQPHIAIVGASLAGLSLALSLVFQKDVQASDIVVLEGRSSQETPKGAVTLTSNSLRIFDKLGIYEHLRDLGYPFLGQSIRDAQGQILNEQAFGNAEMFGYDPLRFRREPVIRVLEGEVRKAGVTVLHDCSLREILEETSSNVVFKVRRGGESGELETMSARVLVGADGLHSRIRSWVTGGAGAPVYAGLAMIASVAPRTSVRYSYGFEDAKNRPEYAMMVMTQKGGIIFVAQEQDASEIFFARVFPMPERRRSEWEALGEDKKELVRMLNEGKSELPDMIASATEQAREDDSTYVWPMYTLPKLERYVSVAGRCIIIGDAAHTIPPAAAQGANIAVEDAWTLAPLLSKADSTKLDEWQKARIERAKIVAELSVKLMNLRLPPEERAKLPQEQVFKIGEEPGIPELLKWIFGEGRADQM